MRVYKNNEEYSYTLTAFRYWNYQKCFINYVLHVTKKKGLYFKNEQNDILKGNKPYYLNKQINVSK